MSLRAALAGLALFSFGCSGTALDVGSTDAGPTSKKEGGVSTIAPEPTEDAGSDAPGVLTAKAVCAQNEGLDFATTGTDSQTPAGIAAKLVGRWYSCDATVPSAMRTTPAIEFDADGTWKRLVSDGAGGLTAGTAVADAGTWKIFRSDGVFVATTDTTPGTYPYIYIVDAMGAEQPTGMTFIDSPRLLFTVESNSGLRTSLVPLT